MPVTAGQIVARGLQLGKSEDEIKQAVERFKESQKTGVVAAPVQVAETGVPTGRPVAQQELAGPQIDPELLSQRRQPGFTGPTTLEQQPIPEITAGEIGKGFGKELLGRAQQFATMGQKGLEAITGIAPATGTIEIPKELTTPVGPGQKIGATAEQIAEFVIPGGAPAKAAKGLKLGKAGTVVARTGLEALTGTGIAGLQEGKIGKEEIMTGVLSGIGGELIGGIGKGVSKLAKKGAEKLTKSSIRLSPSQIEKLAEPRLLKDVKAEQFLNERGISGSIESIRKQLGSRATESKKLVDEGLGLIGGKFSGAELQRPANILKETFDSIPQERLTGDVLKQKQLVDSFANRLAQGEGLTLTEANQMKRVFDELGGAFTKSGDLKQSLGGKVSQEVRSELKTFIENKAEQAGFKNLKALNKETQISNALKKVIKPKKTIQEEIINSLSVGAAGLGAATANVPALIGAAGIKIAGKVANSPKMKTALAKQIRKLSSDELIQLQRVFEQGTKNISKAEKSILQKMLSGAKSDVKQAFRRAGAKEVSQFLNSPGI